MDRYQLNKNGEGYTDLTALEGIKRADKGKINRVYGVVVENTSTLSVKRTREG